MFKPKTKPPSLYYSRKDDEYYIVETRLGRRHFIAGPIKSKDRAEQTLKDMTTNLYDK